MIQLQYLVDLGNTGRSESCYACGRLFDDDPKMVRVQFIRQDKINSFCLCDKCRQELYHKI